MAEETPYFDFVVKLGLDLFILKLGFTPELLSNNLDGLDDALAVFNRSDLFDDTEASIADLLADNILSVVANALTFVVGFGRFQRAIICFPLC